MMRFDFLHDPRPELVERAMSLRLPPEIYVQTLVAAGLCCAILASFVVEGVRVHTARSLESRARSRFEATRDALSAVRLQWQQLDALVDNDRQLRAIRLSGSDVAVRIARLGNAIPMRAWATSLTASPTGYTVKARGSDLPAASLAFENLLDDRVLSGDASFRMSRDSIPALGAIAFEIRAGTAR